MGHMNVNDVEKLAALSRVALSDEEKNGFLKDFQNILEYVGEIKSLAAEEPKKETGELRNIMRDDELRPAPLSSREELLSAVPKKEGDYVKVKSVFND